jgi:hypothetical protein
MGFPDKVLYFHEFSRQKTLHCIQYLSFEGLELPRSDDDVQWLMYWIVRRLNCLTLPCMEPGI